MLSLIQTYGFSVVIVILFIAIPSIITMIGWCKSLWAKRTNFIEENRAAGRKQLQEEEKEESRFSAGELRIQKLEENLIEMRKMIQNQERIIHRLEASDKLTIKTYIKEQHAIWMRKGYIDSQVLELLEERFKIYREEGGNSWAEKLMNEMRALPFNPAISVLNNREN